MSRHIVVTFHSMLIVRLTFRHKIVKNIVKISSHVWIGIFVYSQSARRMLHKDIE